MKTLFIILIFAVAWVFISTKPGKLKVNNVMYTLGEFSSLFLSFFVGLIINIEDSAHGLKSNAAENIQLDFQKENEKLQHKRNRRTPQQINYASYPNLACGIEELYPEIYNKPAINKENQHDNVISNNNQSNSTTN